MTRAAQVLSRELDLYNEFWAIARGDSIPEVKPEPRGRFVVIEHTPGYMPEADEPAVFDTESEAWDYLVEEVGRYVEHLQEVEVKVDVKTYKEFGYVEVGDGGLGRVFYINHEEEGQDD